MKQVLMLAGIAAALGFVAVCVCVCLLLLQVRNGLEDARTRLQTIAQKVTVDLDEAHRVLLEAGLTAEQARKASVEERAALPALTAGAQQSFRSLDGVLEAAQRTTLGVGASQQQIAASAVGVLQATQAQVERMQPVIEQAKSSLSELQTVEADLDARVNDPAIASSLRHIDGSTAAIEASAKDVQQEVHTLTHPGWPRRVWHGLLDVAHVFNPLVAGLG